jgi:hypothetical protein
MEAPSTYETLVNFKQSTQPHNLNDKHLHTYRSEKQKSYLNPCSSLWETKFLTLKVVSVSTYTDVMHCTRRSNSKHEDADVAELRTVCN